MFRCIGQLLAILAVVASALNAQCALSCSLQAMAKSSGQGARTVSSRGNKHACCPEQKIPAPDDPDRPRQQQPCPDPVLTINDVTFATPIQHSETPRYFAGSSGHSVDAALPVRLYALPVVVDSSGIPEIPAFFILRV
ncbi:MAG: hypothetical protein M3Z09_17035 [Acidobacteriota bacterium]|nr:hypothetical protein [Acidobacteriota bacterium]